MASSTKEPGPQPPPRSCDLYLWATPGRRPVRPPGCACTSSWEASQPGRTSPIWQLDGEDATGFQDGLRYSPKTRGVGGLWQGRRPHKGLTCILGALFNVLNTMSHYTILNIHQVMFGLLPASVGSDLALG